MSPSPLTVGVLHTPSWDQDLVLKHEGAGGRVRGVDLVPRIHSTVYLFR